MVVDPTDTSCATIRAGGTGGIDGTSFQFIPSSESHPAAQVQSGSSTVVFNYLLTGDYGIASSPPPGYILARACWSDAPGGTTGETSWATLGTLQTLTWDVGYVRGEPWSQVQGGEVCRRYPEILCAVARLSARVYFGWYHRRISVGRHVRRGL